MDVNVKEPTDEQFYEGMKDNFKFSGQQLAIPLLLIKQGTTKPSKFKDAGMPVPEDGSIYNSTTLKSYGKKVRAVVLYATIMYYEWKPELGGLCGRYSEAEFYEQVKDGQIVGRPYEGFFRKFASNGEEIIPVSTKTGPAWNELVETWVYALWLPDHPEDGIVCYNSTVGNMKYLKQWNSAMSTQKVPKYAQIWNVETRQDETDSGIAYQFGAGGKSAISFSGVVPPPLFLANVKPVLELAQTASSRIDVAALEDKTGAAGAAQGAAPAERVETDEVPF
jgi:hypothetical protein